MTPAPAARCPHRLARAGPMVATLAVLAALALPGAGPAGATGSAGPSPSPAVRAGRTGCPAALLVAVRNGVVRALTTRSQRLAALTSRVDGATALTTGDRSTLQSDLADESSGISALMAKVPDDTTCAQLRTDAQAMVLDYRVFYVMSPQVDLVVVADQEAALATRLAGYGPLITQAITRAAQQGLPTAAAQAAATSYQAKLAAAGPAMAGVTAQVLAQTPTGAPGNRTVLEAAAGSLRTGRTDLRQAVADLRAIRTDLT